LIIFWRTSVTSAVVVGRGRAGAQFDVAVLDRALDQADGGGAGLVAAFHGGNEGGLDGVADHGAGLIACGRG
jgi:hypothetical protein